MNGSGVQSDTNRFFVAQEVIKFLHRIITLENGWRIHEDTGAKGRGSFIPRLVQMEDSIFFLWWSNGTQSPY